MKIKNLIYFGLLILMAACNTESGPQGCYDYIKNNDTISLKLVNTNGVITGTLVYNLYQKDKNFGTIQGRWENNLLVADYSFNSEGTQSIRQVAFKRIDHAFEEGYGEMEEKDGKLVFKDIKSLDFTHSSIVLNKVECKK